MKGAVYQRGSKWYYKFRVPQRDPSTGRYPWITKGGYDTEREAWKACREAMREADRGRVVKPSTRTVAQFLTEWLTAVEPTLDATTWRSWSDYARAYVIPHIGAERLQRLDEPQLLQLYAKLLAEGRVKRDNDTVMYEYWSMRTAKGGEPTPRQVSEACDTTIHAARDRGAAVSLGHCPQTGFAGPGAQDRPQCPRLPASRPRRRRRLEIPHRQSGQQRQASAAAANSPAGVEARGDPDLSWPRCATTDSRRCSCWNSPPASAGARSAV